MTWQQAVYGALCLKTHNNEHRLGQATKMMLTTGGLACCLLGTGHLNICVNVRWEGAVREIGRGRVVGGRVESGQGLYMDAGATVT